MQFSLSALFLVLLIGHSERVMGAETTTVVTTYVTKVQTERENTRWTLTEWLRIKERMKMMDVWLAMFSEPKKDQFRPEFAFGWTLFQPDVPTGTTGNGPREGREASVFLTNIVTATLGVRTLNIDFGLEGQDRRNTNFQKSESTSTGNSPTIDQRIRLLQDSGTETLATPAALPRVAQGMALLRVFGKNIQDSSIVFKAGRFDGKDENSRSDMSGRVVGADLNLYFLKWLGIGGQGFAYTADTSSPAWKTGMFGQYGGFFEISILRLGGGVFVEKWEGGSSEAAFGKINRTGYYYTAKLQL